MLIGHVAERGVLHIVSAACAQRIAVRSLDGRLLFPVLYLRRVDNNCRNSNEDKSPPITIVRDIRIECPRRQDDDGKPNDTPIDYCAHRENG